MNRILRHMTKAALAAAMLLAGVSPALALRAAPVAASFSTAVVTNSGTALQLQGSDPDGTPLSYAVTSSPSHGAVSQLDAATGALVYTPNSGYAGADTFQYTVTSGGDTSPPGTVTITVTSAKTHVVDTVTNLDGSPRRGKVSFFLTQVASGPSGVMPAKSSVTCALSGAGQCDVYLYPSRAVSPVQFYQAWYTDQNGQQQLLGIYDIPASTTAITLLGHRVTDANLQAQFVFASKAEVEALIKAVAAITSLSVFDGSTDQRLQK